MSDATVDLRLLGGALLVEGAAEDGGALDGPAAQRYPLALMALVATASDRTLSRSKLAGLFWPEAPESTARSRLNTHVHRIRAELGEVVLVSRGDELWLNPDALGCDVWRFERAVERGDLETAVETYGGPFLDGFHLKHAPEFEKDVERVRARLRASYREALESLAEAAEQRGEPETAARWWRERANGDPYDGRVIRRLMEALASANNRTAALRAAEVHARLVEEELGTAPSAEVRRLEERLREGPSAPEPPDGEVPARPALDPARGATPARAGGDSVRSAEAEREAGGRARPTGVRRWGSVAVAALLAVVVAGAGWYLLAADENAATEARSSSIAVLPFATLGGERPGGLADGLHADLLTRLARVSGLQVVSGTSMQRYRGTEASVAGIAEELGVGWVLEGSVQRSGDQIQVNAQLIDARTDVHAWAQRYRRELTAENVFDIQAELTRQIARALEVTLSASDQRNLERRPTDDLKAYDYFLRARAYQMRPPTGVPDVREANRIALGLLDRAVEQDSGFAEVWARKSQSHLALYQLSVGRAEDELERARAAAERAREVDPDGPWGHLALAELKRRTAGDLVGALEHYRATGLTTSDVLLGMAKVQQERGRLGEAIRLYERAQDLDPLNHEVFFQSWWAYGLLRRYDEAAAVLDRVLELAPDHRAARLYRDRLPLHRDGDAAAVGPAVADELEVRWRLGDHRGALASEPIADVPRLRLEHQVGRGLVLTDMGDPAAARATLDSARAGLEAELLGDTSFHDLGKLGRAYAGLGRREAALEAARRAVEMAEREGGVLLASQKRLNLAVVQALVGEEEAALATLETYLSNPGLCSYRCVASHPILARLADHPGFEVLERRFGS